jgi:hypothetical protein
MKDLSENINWGVTIKTFIYFPEKCSYLLFTSNGAVLKTLGKGGLLDPLPPSPTFSRRLSLVGGETKRDWRRLLGQGEGLKPVYSHGDPRHCSLRATPQIAEGAYEPFSILHCASRAHTFYTPVYYIIETLACRPV